MDINSISTKITNIKISLNKFCDKIVDLENRSRRNNLRIVGIPEKPGETLEESDELMKSTLIEKLGLNTGPPIERAHRTGKSSRSGSSQTRDVPRPIVCQLYDWKEKEHILKQARILKPTSLFVNEDVAQTTMAKRREQMSRLRQAKQDGETAYFILDK